MTCLLSRKLNPLRKSIAEPNSVLSQQGTNNKHISWCHLLGHKAMCFTTQLPVLGCSFKILLRFIVVLERQSSALGLVMWCCTEHLQGGFGSQIHCK